MREAGYATHWYGKGHTGYKSWRHLPQQLGFDDFVGFLGGAQDHFSAERWGLLCAWAEFCASISFTACFFRMLMFKRARLLAGRWKLSILQYKLQRRHIRRPRPSHAGGLRSAVPTVQATLLLSPVAERACSVPGTERLARRRPARHAGCHR